MVCHARRCHGLGVSDMAGAGGSIDVVRAVGFGTLAMENSSAMGSSSAFFVIADFSALAGDAGGFAFAFDFFFGGFFTERACKAAATIHGL
jgi:hypothetical protein